MERSERTIMRKEARRRRSMYGEREEEVDKGGEKVSREEERRVKSRTSGERDKRREEKECEERKKMRWDVCGRVGVRRVARHLM